VYDRPFGRAEADIDPDGIKQFIDILSIIIPGILGLVGVVIVWWAKTRTLVMKAQKELLEAQTALAHEQRKGVSDLPTQMVDAFTKSLAEAIGPLASLVKSLTEANERLTAKTVQLQLDNDRMCSELDNLKLEWNTQREVWQRELKAKDAQLTEANTTVISLRSEIAVLRDRISVLEARSKKVDVLVTEKEELQKERDDALALVKERDAEIARLTKALSDSEASRAKAEAELLKRIVQQNAVADPTLPSDPNDPRV
jgi:chromosome segregation ATPase